MTENTSWQGEGWYTNEETTDGAIWAETEEDLDGLDSEYHGDGKIPEECLRQDLIDSWVNFDVHYVTDEVRKAAAVLAYAETGTDSIVTDDDVERARAFLSE